MSLASRIDALAATVAAQVKDIRASFVRKIQPTSTVGSESVKRATGLVLWSENLPNGAGSLVIQTNLGFNNHMTTLRIHGYNYYGNDNVIDLDVGFYAYADGVAGAFVNTGVVNRGNLPVTVRLMRRTADGLVAVVLDSGGVSNFWQYPKIAVDGVFGHVGPLDTELQGWTITRTTDLTAYTSMDTPTAEQGVFSSDARLHELTTLDVRFMNVGESVEDAQLPSRLRASIGSNASGTADTALTTGWWYIDGSGVGEKPPGGNDYFVEVIRHADSGLYMMQIAYGFNENRQYMRRRTGSTTWTPWVEVVLGTDTRMADKRTPTDSSTASLRAHAVMSGGGTLSVSATTAEVRWSHRFIIISNGRGSFFSTAGYFDISLPAIGTVITGVGGAANQTVTSAGVLLNVWHALYYILPLGSGNGSIAENFRLVNYTVDFVVPETWVLIAVRNGDQDEYLFGNGISMTSGKSSVVTNPYQQYTLTTDARLSDARPPLAHTHAVSNLVTTGSKSSATFLRGDDVWASPPIQTYATQTQAQAESSTDIDGRLTTGQRLFQAISKWAVTLAGTQTITGFKTFSVGLSGTKNSAGTAFGTGDGLETRNDLGYPAISFHKGNAYAPQIRAISGTRFEAVDQAGSSLVEFLANGLYDNYNRVYSAANPPPADDTGWITPPLLNGWVAYGSGFQAPRYRRIKGVVYVQGLVTGGTLNSDVFALPVGFRPSAILIASVSSDVAGARIDVLNSVQQQGGGTGFLSLAIPPFPADQ